jgi:mannosyltransferase
MNVFFDNKAYYIQKFGGVSVVFKELQERALRDTQVNYKFIEYGEGGNSYQDGLMIPPECVIPKPKKWFGIKRLLPVRLKEKEPFVFHSTYFSYCSNPNAININTVHDFIEAKTGNGRGSYFRSKFQGYIIGKSDMNVCVSENTKRDLLELYPSICEDKLCVIYNSASDVYSLDKNKQVLLPFPAKSYLLYVGARVKRKNYHLLRDVISHTEYNLVITGKKLSDEERRELEKHIPASRYVSLGYTEDKRLNELYNHAAALIYPSSYEGFGIPVLEAQKAGCPVIALNTSSIPEVISPHPETCPLLMKEATKEELLSKVRLLSDNDLMAKVVGEGLENAKRFSWDKMYNEYRKLYEELLNRTTYRK